MPYRKTTVSGLRKAAILMVALPRKVSAELMANLDRESVETLTREIATLGEVTREQRDAVIEEFFQISLARQYVEQGGVEHARELLEQSLSPDSAREVLGVVQQAIASAPFAFLQRAESENILAYIQEEHPQTVAVILAHLPPQRAAEVLTGLPPKMQGQVVRRIANMEHTSPEIIKEVERGLERRLSNFVIQKFEKTGGVRAVAEMLNLADRATEKGVMESLEEEDPELVEQIRRLMFVFEDIMLVNDKGIQAMLKEVDQQELALALKGASDELKEKIFRNMSERAGMLIKEEMEYMGPVRISEVEAAQQRIVDSIRRLEEAGQALIQGRGPEEEIIV